MKEDWKPIPGFPNYEFNLQTLEVKSIEREAKHWRGGYRTIKERILKLNKCQDGYYNFCLCQDGKRTTLKRSQISWLVNVGSLSPKGYHIDHIDGIKTHDDFGNLQLLLHRANISKGYSERGKTLPTGVSWDKHSKKYRAAIKINGKRKSLGYFVKVKEASEAYQKELSKLI